MRTISAGFVGLAVVLASSFGSRAQAGDPCTVTINQQTGYKTPVCLGKITELYPQGSSQYGNVYVKMDADLGPLSGTCAPFGGKYLVLQDTARLFKETYSALLAALVSGKQVKIRISVPEDPSTNCVVGYIVIYQ